MRGLENISCLCWVLRCKEMIACRNRPVVLNVQLRKSIMFLLGIGLQRDGNMKKQTCGSDCAAQKIYHVSVGNWAANRWQHAETDLWILMCSLENLSCFCWELDCKEMVACRNRSVDLNVQLRKSFLFVLGFGLQRASSIKKQACGSEGSYQKIYHVCAGYWDAKIQQHP